MINKTAWDNVSLIGCYITFLMNGHDWINGMVVDAVQNENDTSSILHQIHIYPKTKSASADNSDSHVVWLNMKHVLFFIVNTKIKSDSVNDIINNEKMKLSLSEDKYYMEEISLNYAIAQSILSKVYSVMSIIPIKNKLKSRRGSEHNSNANANTNNGFAGSLDSCHYSSTNSSDHPQDQPRPNSLSTNDYYHHHMLPSSSYALQEIGHSTIGHLCVTSYDKLIAKQLNCSLLYGELFPRGISKACDMNHLNVSNSKIFYDLGMGTGKLPIQVFLQYPALEYIYGVELSLSRYKIAELAVLELLKLLNGNKFDITQLESEFDYRTLEHTSKLNGVSYQVDYVAGAHIIIKEVTWQLLESAHDQPCKPSEVQCRCRSKQILIFELLLLILCVYSFLPVYILLIICYIYKYFHYSIAFGIWQYIR